VACTLQVSYKDDLAQPPASLAVELLADDRLDLVLTPTLLKNILAALATWSQVNPTHPPTLHLACGATPTP
jgi:hypothetical protein